MGKKIKQNIIIGIMLGILAAIIVILITSLNIFNNFEAKTFDWRYRAKIAKLRKQQHESKIEDIIIIDIDNRSLEKLGRFEQWSRDYHAQVIDYVDSAGALVIGFDILFMEKDIQQAVNDRLVTRTKQAGNVCYAMSFSDAEPDAFLYKMDEPPPGFNAEKFSYLFDNRITNNIPQADRLDGEFMMLYNAAQRIGFANFYPDDDGIIRKTHTFINFAGRQYPSFALSMILYLLNIDQKQIKINLGDFITLNINNEKIMRVPIDNQGKMLINYKGTYQTFRYISYYDVLSKRIPPEFFTDRIVLIGSSVPGLYDLRPIPFQNAFPGVEINGNIICNILTQDFIYKNSKFITMLILFGLTVFIAIISIFPRLSISFPFILIITLFFLYFTFFFFEHQNIWIENVRPTLGIMFSFLSVVSYRLMTEQKDKRKIRNMFQHYISASVVNEILKKPEMLMLGGERKFATALFADIKDFTSYSEKLAPEELISILNEYLSEMSEVILKYEGYLDKYEGDAIVAILGIPIEQEDHALRACFVALDMQQALIRLREKWKNEGKPLFEARIGINSGPMIAGNIGGKDRFDYTAIGDSVNLASRLEGANKMYGTNIVISEDTFKEVSDKVWVRELDFIRVKGKVNPVRVYELIGRKTENIDPIRASSLEYFVQGLELYRQRNWVKAYDFFQKALQLTPYDGPSREFIRRCKMFIENPRNEDWDGIFELREK